MKTINPFTEETIEVPETESGALQQIFTDAQLAQKAWTRLSVKNRLKQLQKVFDRLQRESEQFARLISEEVGKPIRFSRIELARTIEEFSYTLQHAAQWLADEKVPEESPQGIVRYDPLGVVAVISPWNFPILIPLRSIVPALAAGNSVVFKPSELSPRTALSVSKLFSDEISEVPGILSVIVGGKEVGAAVVELPVALISFTGSIATGKSIARSAADFLKRVVLELGGLDAAIVLEDVNVAKTAEEIVRTNAANSGQVCSTIKRVYVDKKIFEPFVNAAVEIAKKLSYGDPLDEQTDIGPLVSRGQLERVRSFFDDATKQGSRIVSARTDLPEKGYFFSQQILTDIPRGTRVLHDEPFGPLLPIIPFSSTDEAIQLANDTRYGLNASVWTNDRTRAAEIAAQLEVGSVGLNSHRVAPPGVPFGGCKQSGIGRTKTREGLREFTNVKFVQTV